MDVLKVSAADFQRNIGRYQDIALRQPVAVMRDGRESWVLISAEEYRRLKRRDREALAIEAFTTADVQAVRRARPSPASASYDSEVTPNK